LISNNNTTQPTSDWASSSSSQMTSHEIVAIVAKMSADKSAS
jgi:hypothetical protein